MPGGKVNVRHTIFDHTTIPATILRRFCEGKVPIMGARTSAIADVGEMLTRDTPRPRAEFEQLAREMKQVATRTAGTVQGKVPRSPMRRPQLARVEDEFTNLIAFASAVTGGGKR